MGACAFFSGFSDQIVKPHFRPTTLLSNAFMESLVNSHLNYFNFDEIYCVYMCFAAAAAAALSLLLLALLFKCTLMHTNGTWLCACMQCNADHWKTCPWWNVYSYNFVFQRFNLCHLSWWCCCCYSFKSPTLHFVHCAIHTLTHLQWNAHKSEEIEKRIQCMCKFDYCVGISHSGGSIPRR